MSSDGIIRVQNKISARGERGRYSCGRVRIRTGRPYFDDPHIALRGSFIWQKPTSSSYGPLLCCVDCWKKWHFVLKSKQVPPHATRSKLLSKWNKIPLVQYTPLSVKICFLLWKFQIKIFKIFIIFKFSEKNFRNLDFFPKFPIPQRGRQWRQRGRRLLTSKFQNFHFQLRIAIARGI